MSFITISLGCIVFKKPQELFRIFTFSPVFVAFFGQMTKSFLMRRRSLLFSCVCQHKETVMTRIKSELFSIIYVKLVLSTVDKCCWVSISERHRIFLVVFIYFNLILIGSYKTIIWSEPTYMIFQFSLIEFIFSFT